MSAPTVLLRSSWQTVNIGDVAHTPGVANAIRTYAPDVRVVHWAINLDGRERQMFAERVPWMEVVDGDLDEHGKPTTPELAAAWDSADVFIHGSAGVIGRSDEIDAWRATDRPYVYFGVTSDPVCPPTVGTLRELRAMIDVLPEGTLDPVQHERLSSAAAVLCRDSITLRYLQRQGITPGHLSFGPDGTFAYTVADDAAAEALLERYNLRPQEFACFVPRSRYTPYFRLRNFAPKAEDWRREAINVAVTETDLSALVDAITTWVRTTGLPALVVPEMIHAVEMAQQVIPGLLPADVSDKVHILDRYWPLEEATGVYKQTRMVISMECHAPIIATALGVPAVYLRQPSDTIKGEMYADLDGTDMVLELERDRARIPDAIRGLIERPADAKLLRDRVASNAAEALKDSVRVTVEAASRT